MTCIRHMALWLAAVIVLIAVGLMPSGAQAHAGHAHGPAGTAAVSLLPLSAASAARLGGETRKIVPDGAIRAVLVLAAARIRSLSAGAGDGACCNAGCRSPGSCCTGAALAPDQADAAEPRMSGDRALARALPARTDIVPEALPEPPRSDA